MTVDPLAQMEQFKQWARVLIVPTEKDEVKYQHLQSIADNLEVSTDLNHVLHVAFVSHLCHAVRT